MIPALRGATDQNQCDPLFKFKEDLFIASEGRGQQHRAESPGRDEDISCPGSGGGGSTSPDQNTSTSSPAAHWMLCDGGTELIVLGSGCGSGQRRIEGLWSRNTTNKKRLNQSHQSEEIFNPVQVQGGINWTGQATFTQGHDGGQAPPTLKPSALHSGQGDTIKNSRFNN